MRKLLTLSVILVIVDQATKLAIKGFNLFGIHHKGMELDESISVIGDFLLFTFVENPGMAFGLDLGMPFLLGLFSIGAAIFLVYLLRQSYDNKIEGFHVALAMILGGAVGNLIDRVFYGVFYSYGPLFYGKVVDFINVDIPDIAIFGKTLDRFYVFNIADSAVSVGIVLLLFFYPKYQRREEAKKAALADSSPEDELILADDSSGKVESSSNNPAKDHDTKTSVDAPPSPSEADITDTETRTDNSNSSSSGISDSTSFDSSGDSSLD